MNTGAATREDSRTTPLAENQPYNHFCDYRTDYGYKDFDKSLFKRLLRFAGFFLTVTHNLPPLIKISFRTTSYVYNILHI